MKTSTLLFAPAVLAMTVFADPTLLDASADPVRVFRGRNLRTAGFGKWYRDKFDIGEGDSATHAKHWLYDHNQPIKGANRVELAELLNAQVEKGYVSLADAHMVAQQYIHSTATTWDVESSDRLRHILISKVPVAPPAPATTPVVHDPTPCPK